MTHYHSTNTARSLTAAVLSLVAGVVFVLGAVAPAEVRLNPTTSFVA
ncbi:hypothetical protein [Sphingomonas sp.]|nr:hypothetical protein [Sphingomonas sp.]MBX9796376.1 hypothetical protein [Sphingomonas sp.]